MWLDRQDLYLTSILKNSRRRRKRWRAAIIGVIPGLGALALAAALLNITIYVKWGLSFVKQSHLLLGNKTDSTFTQKEKAFYSIRSIFILP